MFIGSKKRNEGTFICYFKCGEDLKVLASHGSKYIYGEDFPITKFTV